MHAEQYGNMDSSWKRVLGEELSKPYMHDLMRFLEDELASGQRVYPPKELWFAALKHTPFPEVEVVIVGQDPYHGEGQAEGLSFSVPKGVKLPPSLKNIYKELESDLGIQPAGHGSLVAWARQGVLLLNATLTVRESNPLSHHKKGWEKFTDAIIRVLAERKDPIVFILWGNSAINKFQHATGCHQGAQHLILKSPHPSPLSAYQGFFGSKPFSQANAFLEAHGKRPINWRVQ
jgi:uracil-DNA glycosylase